MDLKVSPTDEDTPKAPLLDLEAVERRVRTLETTPAGPTLHHLATREPTSFHQTTIYYGLVRPNTPPRRKYGLLATSIGIVFLQCFVAVGLAHGVTFSTCSEHSDCSRGTFCDGGICEWCYGPLRPCCQTNSTDTCILDEKHKGGFSDELREEKNRKAMCDVCTTSKGFETLQDVVKDRMNSMMLQDWLTLFLASLVVACA